MDGLTDFTSIGSSQSEAQATVPSCVPKPISAALSAKRWRQSWPIFSSSRFPTRDRRPGAVEFGRSVARLAEQHDFGSGEALKGRAKRGIIEVGKGFGSARTRRLENSWGWRRVPAS